LLTTCAPVVGVLVVDIAFAPIFNAPVIVPPLNDNLVAIYVSVYPFVATSCVNTGTYGCLKNLPPGSTISESYMT
jgi:hypothetical protein